MHFIIYLIYLYTK